jgi:hypothetical protein
LQTTNSNPRSYDYDTDPHKRAETPGFYGYIPDKGRRRVVLLVIMTFNSATVLFARCLGVAMLMLVGASYLFGFLAVDMAVYLAYKASRDDFYHWLPMDGATGFALSLWMRFSVKIIADFASVVQLRVPGEMGGLHFTVNTVMGFVFCYVAIKIFFVSDVGKAVGMLNEDFATNAFFVLFGFWALNAALGVSMMKKEYRRTFVSTESGSEWAMKFFLEGETDKARSKTARLNKKKWEPIRAAVKDWVQKGWWKWKDEMPGWFNDSWIAKLPDDFIPAQENRVALQQLRRRSSAFGGNGGSDGSRRLSLKGGGGLMSVVPVAGARQE